MTDGTLFRGLCRDAGKLRSALFTFELESDLISIVEYATREQAQIAVNTLSNQNLMGRLVYVREVRWLASGECSNTDLASGS